MGSSHGIIVIPKTSNLVNLELFSNNSVLYHQGSLLPFTNDRETKRIGSKLAVQNPCKGIKIGINFALPY